MDTVPVILKSRLRAALAGIAADAEPQVAAATDTRFGDYQSNIAMILAKPLRANPRQLAQDILAKLDVADCCEPPEIAGAGFINFRLRPDWLAQRFTALAADERLGVPAPAAPRTMVIDFSSPNVAKPMHVGHLRSTILGDSLASIGEFIGHRVVRDNHIGDWGTQFGMLLHGWKTELDRAALDADPLSELERIYILISPQCDPEKPQYHPETAAAARAELVKLQDGDAENLCIWKEMQRLSEVQFATIYGRLGVRFHVTLGESFYNPWLKQIVEDLRQRGIATESEGAWCVFSEGILPPEQDPFMKRKKDTDGWFPNPAMVQKNDGAANYTTTDLATLRYRLKEWTPDEIIYVTDGRQQHHFCQLFDIFRRSQPELAASVRLNHVWFGTILGEDRKPLKSRDGNNIKLAQLLDEAEQRALALVTEKNPDLPEAERRDIARIVGLGAVKYADLLPNRQSDYVFSWEKMLSFQGNTAPYLQYSYVRIRSIFRKAGAEFQISDFRFQIVEPAELALAKKLLQFGEVLPQVLDDYRPNVLANYLYELAATFHSFFEACPVLKAEAAVRASRLTLCDTTARVLQRGLALLGIEVPQRM